MVAMDFWRSGIDVNRSKNSFLYTDAYTALVLSGLGVSNVVGLDSKIANQIFSPLISEPSPAVRNSFESFASASDVSLLMNARYWGMGVLKKYGVLGELPLLEVDNDIRGMIAYAQNRKFERIVAALLPIAKRQVAMPMVEVDRESVDDNWLRSPGAHPNNQSRVTIYRDSALIKLPDLGFGEVAKLNVDGVGDSFDVMVRTQGERYLKGLTLLSSNKHKDSFFGIDFALIHVDHQDKVITVEATQPMRDVELFLTLDMGHLAGLGEIWDIDID